MNFPTSPSAGDLFTINNITYKYNNPGWEIHRTTADTITTDCGVIPFAGQSAAPAAIPVVAELVGSPVAEVLYHFDGNTDDSSGNGNDGANTGVSFVASGVTGFTSGKAGVFDGAAMTSGGDDLVAFDDPGIGTSDFTVEFWWRRDLKTVDSGGYKDCPVSIDTGTGTTAGGFSIYFFGSTSARVKTWDGSSSHDDNWTVPSHVADAWHHFRYVRSGTLHHIYWDGTKVGNGAAHAAHVIGGVGLTWHIGKLWDGTAFPMYNLEGQMEEFRISKTAVFTGTSFTPPTAPYSDPIVTPAISGKAQLYGKNVAGGGATEGVVSLHFDNNITDTGSSGTVVTHPGAYNGAPTFVAPGKYGSHALHFDPSGNQSDFLVLPTSSDLQWDADFTIDFWYKWDATQVGSTTWIALVSSDISAGSNGPGITFAWNGSNRANRERRFNINIPPNGNGAYCYADFDYWSSSGVSGNPAHVADADLSTMFHHIAICRTSDVVEMWLNGKKLTLNTAVFFGSSSSTELVSNGIVNNAGNDYYIGRERHWAQPNDNDSTHVNDNHGYMDEFRIVKGSAEFSGASFTPPARAHGEPSTTITKIYAMNSAGVESPLI